MMSAISIFVFSSFSVSAPGVPSGDTDIAVSFAALEPGDDTVVPGDRVTVDSVFVNGGSSDLDEIPIGYFLSRDASLSADDVLLDTDEVDLDPGESEDESEQFTIPGQSLHGRQFILVAADFGDVLAESDETNNVRAAPIEVLLPGVTTYGEASGGANIGWISALASPAPATPLSIKVGGMPDAGIGVVFASFTRTFGPRFGGVILADLGTITSSVPAMLVGGEAQLNLELPSSMSGASLYVQGGFRDASQPQAVALTHGLEVTLP